MLCFSYYLLCFLFNKIREEGRIGFACHWGLEKRAGEVAQTMYTHVSKYKNDKIKKIKYLIINSKAMAINRESIQNKLKSKDKERISPLFNSNDILG
jgi:hypothetical protein